ncbi:uncharacterized protein [Eucyclogobius newberryi]|uniref:uncharacterized protein n=1 Tax=Eucyclogobius newberryi TaxID=166745 RepID=UPI003B5C7348
MLNEKGKTPGQKTRTPKVIINNERRHGNGKPGNAKDKHQSGSVALTSPLIGGLPGSSLLIGPQAASLQLAQLQAQLALTQINPLTVSSRANSSAAAPSPTASAISLLNLLKIANNMYNPYGNQRQGQGQYGANVNPDRDSRMGTTNIGPFNPPGASGSSNPLSSRPLFSQPMSYRPEPSRSDLDRNIDLQLSRAREQSSTQPPLQRKPQGDETYSPFSTYSSSSYSGPSSASSYSAPPSASSYSGPSSASSYSAPPSASSYSGPSSASSYSAPPSASSYSGPSSASSYSAPPSASSYSAPPSASSYSAPPSGSSYSASPSGSSYSAPPSGSSYSAPPSGSSYSAPPSGSSYSGPSLGSSYSAPPSGSSYSAPPSGSSYSAPPSGSSYSAPSSASSYSAPSHSAPSYSAPSSASTYSATSSSAPRQPSGTSDTDGGVSGSLSWLLNLTKSSSAEPRSFVTSSSSSNFLNTGDSQSNRSESGIPGLGDYPDREMPTPSQRKDPNTSKYSATTAANILRHFNLEKEDLEQLISYPEDEITPDNLPLILRQIRVEKNRKSVAQPSSYKDTLPSRTDVDSRQDPKGNKVMDYAKKDMPASMDYNMDRSPLQSSTSRCYAKDIPPIPSKADMDKLAVLQPSKVIEYGHTGKYTGGTESMGTIARAIQGIMKIDTGVIRQPLQTSTTSSTPAKPVSNLVLPSQDKVGPAASFSSLFSSTFKSASSQPTNKLTTKQNVKSETTQKTGVILVDSIQKREDGLRKQAPSLSVSSKKMMGFPTSASARPIPTLSRSTAGRPAIVPQEKPMLGKPSMKGNLVPVTQTPMTKPPPSPATTKPSTSVKGLPTSAMMQDYAAASPRSFPHTCCLCHKECLHMKDWISHQNSPLHIEKCKFLRLIYPEWDGEVTARDSALLTAPPPVSASQPPKYQRSRSRSFSPGWQFNSERRDKRRSRSHSPPHRRRSPSSSHRARSRSRERRDSPPRRASERRRRASPPKRSEERRSPPRRNEGRHASQRHSEERRSPPRTRTRTPPRSRERRYSPLPYSPDRFTPPRYAASRYSPARYTPPRGFVRYTPPRGHERESLSPWRDRDESRARSRGSRETRSSSDKRSTHKSAAQRKKQNELEKMTKQALESSSALKSLANTADLPALAEMLVPVIMSQMKKINPAAVPSTGTKKKVLKKPTTTTGKKTISTAAKPTAVKPSTMVRLGSIIPPLSHDDVVGFAELFGKTKSVLLFRQKHQAVVCFENEEDAKKLRNAKDIQIKEHPVTIVRYKEAVSSIQRKSPVSALKKPLKSAVKTTTAGKIAPKSAPAKPTASMSIPTVKCTVRKPAVAPKQVAKVAQKPQESKTTCATIAEVVVTQDRKSTAIQRTFRHSSLKAVPIQDDAKQEDDVLEVIEIKKVSLEPIEISSGTDCDDELPKKLLNAEDKTSKPEAILTDKTAVENAEVQAATEETSQSEAATEETSPSEAATKETSPSEAATKETSPSEEVVELAKNVEQSLGSDPCVSTEKDSEKAEAKAVAEETTQSQKMVVESMEENLEQGDLKMSEETPKPEELVTEKDASLPQKNDTDLHAEQEKDAIASQQDACSSQMEASPVSAVAMEQEDSNVIQEEEMEQDKPSGENDAEGGPEGATVEGTVEQNKLDSEQTSTAVEVKSEVPTTDAEEDAIAPLPVKGKPDNRSEREAKPDPKPDPKQDAKTDAKRVSKSPWQRSSRSGSPSPDPSPAAVPPTLGETLDKLLSLNALKTFKYDDVFSPEFLQTDHRIMLFTDLPEHDAEDPYTEEDVVKMIAPFGFQNDANKLYILPQCRMAFFEMPNKPSVRELMQGFAESPALNATLRSGLLKPHVIAAGVAMPPVQFYSSLMRICEPDRVDDNDERMVYISNIPQRDMAALRKTIGRFGDLMNFVPLLNKAFVVFKRDHVTDALGVYHSLLNKTPPYELLRLKAPKSTDGHLTRRMARIAMPGSSETVPGVIVPYQRFAFPPGSVGPFWVTMTTSPYAYPTLAPWLVVPDYVKLPVRQPQFLTKHNRTIMLTGLPVGGYTHWDVVELLRPYLQVFNLHCFLNSVIVLPLQRRALVDLESSIKCRYFTEDCVKKKIALKGTRLFGCLIKSKMFPFKKEEDIYSTCMKLGNNRSPDKHQLDQRLVCVFVHMCTLDVIKLVIDIVTSVAPIFGYLPLANRICIEVVDANAVPKVKEKFSSYKPENALKEAIWSKVLHLETCVDLNERVKNAGNAVMNPDKEQTETENAIEGSGSEGAAQSADPASSSAPAKKRDSELPHIDEDLLKLLTTTVCEKIRHKLQSSDSEQEDRKSQTSEDSSTRRGSDKGKTAEESHAHSSSRHHHSSSSSSTRRSSDSRRDQEKPSSSSDRHHTASRSSKQSARHASWTSSSARSNKDGFKSPSSCNSRSSSPRKPSESSKSHSSGSSSSRSYSTHEKHSERSDKCKTTDVTKSGHKVSEKSVKLNKETIQGLKEISDEGFQIIDSVDDQTCANETLEDASQISEAFQVMDSVDDEPVQVLDNVTKDEAKGEPTDQQLSGGAINQELDVSQCLKDSRPEEGSKRKRDDDDDNDGNVFSKTTKTDDQEGAEQDSFDIVDSIDQTTVEDPQKIEDVSNDEKFVENDEFQIIDEVEDRPKSDSECNSSKISSTLSIRGGRQTRSEEKEKLPKQHERNTRKSKSWTKYETSASRIEEEIVEEFKVVDAVGEEQTQDEETVTKRRSTRGRRVEKEERYEILDSIEDKSDKRDVSTRDMRSRHVKADSVLDEKLHKDDSKYRARYSQERDEHKKATTADKAQKEDATDSEQGAVKILDLVVEDAATISEKSTKPTTSVSTLDEKSPKDEPSHKTKKCQEKYESNAAAVIYKQDSSANLEQGTFELLDEVREETATISEKPAKGKSSKSEDDTPSRRRKPPAKHSQETKTDDAEETYTILDSFEEVSTRATRQTRSSQRDQSSDSSLKRNTPTKRGRTPARGTKKSDMKDLPNVEVRETIEEEFEILDSVEEEPAPPPKTKKGRQRKQPQKTTPKLEGKRKSLLMEESMAEEQKNERQDEPAVAMEVSEKNVSEEFVEEEDEPVYEVLDSLEEDQIPDEKTAENMESHMLVINKNVSEDVSNEDKPSPAVEKPTEKATKHDIAEKDVELQQEIGAPSMEVPEKPVEESPSGFVDQETFETLSEKNKQTPMEEIERSGNLSELASQESEDKVTSEAAVLEAEKLERPSTRMTRSTRSGRACRSEEIPPKQRTSRRSETKRDSIQKDGKEMSETVESKLENSESLKLQVDDEEYRVLDAFEGEKEDGGKEPQVAVKKRVRPRRPPRKSASKSSEAEPKSQVVEEINEVNKEEDKMEDVSEKEELQKSEINKIEDDDPIYEVVDAVEEDQEEDVVSSETCDETMKKEEALVQKDGRQMEDELARGTSQDVGATEKEDPHEVDTNLDQKATEFETLDGDKDEKEKTEIPQIPTSSMDFVEKDFKAVNIETKSDSEMTRKGETKVGKPLVPEETGKHLEMETRQTDLEDSVIEAKDEVAKLTDGADVQDVADVKSPPVDMNLDAVSDEEDFPEYITEEEDGLVVLDEIMDENDDEAEPIGKEEECVVDKGERKTKEAGSELKGERLQAEGVGPKPKDEEESTKDEEGLKEERVKEPRPHAEEDQSEQETESLYTPREAPVEGAPAPEETTETDSSKPVKRKHEEDTDAPNFVTVDEVGEDEMEVHTPKGRGRGRKKGRKTPVRKSTRGRKAAQRDEELEEGQMEPAESELQPSSSADSGETAVEAVPPVELQPKAESEPMRGQSLPELGVETDVRGALQCKTTRGPLSAFLSKVGGKRKSSAEDPHSKRSRSQSPSVPSDIKLPPFRPDTPLGQDFVVPKSGYFCNLCSVFYLTESTAREQHCSSRRHYDNLKKHVERRGTSEC